MTPAERQAGRVRFDLVTGQIGPNPVWLFNNKPVSMEIMADLRAIQDKQAELLNLCKMLDARWVSGDDWSDGESYKLMERIKEVIS